MRKRREEFFSLRMSWLQEEEKGKRILLLRVRYFFGRQNMEGIARFFLERKFYREDETERVAGCDIEIFH